MYSIPIILLKCEKFTTGMVKGLSIPRKHLATNIDYNFYFKHGGKGKITLMKNGNDRLCSDIESNTNGIGYFLEENEYFNCDINLDHKNTICCCNIFISGKLINDPQIMESLP